MRSAREKSSDKTSSPAERASQQANDVSQLDGLLELQQSAGNQAMLRILSGGALQTKPKVSQPTDAPEQEADLIASRIVGSTSGPLVQRKCAACAVGAPCSECGDEQRESTLQVKSTGSGLMVQRAPANGTGTTPAANAGAQAEASPAPAKATPSLIVEDDAKEIRPGQMRKSEFLSQLRSAVCSTADEALSGTMWSAMGCPYIERWLDHYSKQPSSYVERALRKYAPETASARSAAEYIPIVTERVRRGIAEWSETGEVKDLPEEFAAGGMPGATVSGLVGGLLSGIGSAVSGLVSGAGKALSSVGSMLFKRHDGEAGVEGDPQLIQSQLRSGQALDSSVRGRMQSAFGVDFAGVRVHTDARAQELSDGLNARAFTIGSDIAFAGDEYKPGTPVGDALIAHELAHVVQQGGESSTGTAMQKGGVESNSLEEDADMSALGAVVKIWGGARGGLGKLGKNPMPHLRSGLRLQGCNLFSSAKSTTPVALSGDWAKDVKAAKDKSDEAMMLALVKKAIEPKYAAHAAGKSSKEKEDPADYEKSPIINFDINLERKKRANSDSPVGEQPGHSFDQGADTYAIIGPLALDTSSPLITLMYAEHELYHTTHHLGRFAKREPPGKKLTSAEKASKDASEEVETWTNDFVNYFHLVGAIRRGPKGEPMYFGRGWEPLLAYYEKANEGPKKAALKGLTDYFNKPPTPSGEGVPGHPTTPEQVKETFKLWLERRNQSAELIKDIKAQLNL